jgi:hypothetical protein
LGRGYSIKEKETKIVHLYYKKMKQTKHFTGRRRKRKRTHTPTKGNRLLYSGYEMTKENEAKQSTARTEE